MMPDRRPRTAPQPPPPTGTLTASASPLTASGAYPDTFLPGNTGVDKQWQNQAWAYYETNGPLNYAVNWISGSLSRVSLVIAKVIPGVEPEIVETGPAVDTLAQLKWDESAIMADLGVQITVPGRGYLVGTEEEPGVQRWVVYSPDQVRPARDTGRREPGSPTVYELHQYGNKWVLLDEALVTVIRDSDDRYRWRDTSMTKAALAILREIDLLDREIVSTLVSRIANNGILFVPSEISFPSSAPRNDNEDPFVLQLIEAAKQSIKDPGSAGAAIPLPLRVPAQFIEKFRHLTLSEPIDNVVLDARKDAFGRLADTLNMPREILTGVGATNHWNSFQIAEEAVKVHIAPLAELICGCLTNGFLYPQMVANNHPITTPDGGRLVVWYDASALTMRPDLSTRAIELYDRVEISADTLRRETGFTEEDAPDDKDIREQLLKKVATNAQLALTAIAELTGIPQRETTPATTTGTQEPPAPKPGNPGRPPRPAKAPA